MTEETAAALPVRLTFKLTGDNCIKIQHKGMEIIKEMTHPLSMPYPLEGQRDREIEDDEKGEPRTEEEVVTVVEDEDDVEVSFPKQNKKKRKNVTNQTPPPSKSKVEPTTITTPVSATKQTSILSFFKKSS